MSTLEKLEQMPMQDFTAKAYLEYSMYVILDRALPHIADGFKACTTAHYLCDVRVGFVSDIKAQESSTHGW